MSKLLVGLLSFLLFTAVPARADDVYALVGEKATMTVTSDGTPPFSYQWKKNGADIPGAIEAVYVLTVNAGSNGDYSCQVSNRAGSTRSEPQRLTVILPPTKADTQTVIERIIAFLRQRGYIVIAPS